MHTFLKAVSTSQDAFNTISVRDELNKFDAPLDHHAFRCEVLAKERFGFSL